MSLLRVDTDMNFTKCRLCEYFYEDVDRYAVGCQVEQCYFKEKKMKHLCNSCIRECGATESHYVGECGGYTSYRDLDKEDVFEVTGEVLRKMADECPDVKKLLKKGFPDAFKEEQEYCCYAFEGMVSDGAVDNTTCTNQWRITKSKQYISACPFLCGNEIIPPIDP